MIGRRSATRPGGLPAPPSARLAEHVIAGCRRVDRYARELDRWATEIGGRPCRVKAAEASPWYGGDTYEVPLTSEFRWEAEMVDALLMLMAAGAPPWPACRSVREFEYMGGRTDVLVLSDGVVVVAVEAKLTRWRQALQQAYRNTSFAHRSYVILPTTTAARAVAYRAEFERRGIGLCAVSRQRVEVLIEPRVHRPLLPQLTTRAVARLEGPAAA